MKIYILLIASLMLNQILLASVPADDAAIYINKNNQLYFNANINRGTLNQLMSVYESAKNKPDTLIITSDGGEAAASIDAGFWVANKGLHLIVPNYCFSACANYIIPAARSVTLNKGTVLFWHGSINSRGLKDHVLALLDQIENVSDKEKEQGKTNAIEQIDDLRKKEAELYQQLEVDPNLPLYGHLQICNLEYAVALSEKNFYYSIQDLKTMGIRHLTVQGGVWVPEKTELFKEKGIYKASSVRGEKCIQ